MFNKLKSSFMLDSLENLFEYNKKNNSYVMSFGDNYKNSFIQNLNLSFNDNNIDENTSLNFVKFNKLYNSFKEAKSEISLENSIENKSISRKSTKIVKQRKNDKIINKINIESYNKRNFVMKKLIYKLKNMFFTDKLFEKNTLVRELLVEFDKDELTLKRRLYDSLNVLESSGIISKVKYNKSTYYKLNIKEKNNKNNVKKLTYLESQFKNKTNKINNLKLLNSGKSSYLSSLRDVIRINKKRSNFNITQVTNLENLLLNQNKKVTNINNSDEIKYSIPFIIIPITDKTKGKQYSDNRIKIMNNKPLEIINDNDFIKKIFK